MRHAEPGAAGRRCWLRAAGAAGAALGLAVLRPDAAAAAAGGCGQAVYLSFDTGHMGVAGLIGDTLAAEAVAASFFLANERTLDGGGSLDDHWAPWWRRMAEAGHAFGSHTWDHLVWQADLPDGRFMLRPTMGPDAGRRLTLDGAAYRAALQRPADRFRQMTGQPMARIFRAPAGRTSPALLAAAAADGWQHVGWSPAGFLGDELPSERWPNSRLLAQALRDIRGGDILVAHLGIWSRRDPWAPAVLQPLLRGLKARGLCFATLREHPQYRSAFAAR